MITQKQFDALLQINDVSLTKEEEYDVFEFYNANKTTENRNKIALKNYKLIFKPSWEYTKFGSEIDDLSQEAFLGLLKAIDKFDYTAGTKFSTYAYTWFDSVLQKCTMGDNLIHIPFNLAWKVEKMKKIIREYEDVYDNKPTDLYVAKQMEITVSELHSLKQHELRMLSIDYKYSGDDDTITLHNLLEDKKNSIDKAENQLVANIAVYDIIKKYITDEQYELIAKRYGLDGSPPHSFEKLAELYKVSEQRINIKIKTILRKLRSNPKLKAELKDII